MNTGLYQKLVAEGVLRERGARPPVLPVVICNGRSPWTAPANVSALIALETNRDRSRLPALLDTLIELLRSQDDKALTDAFGAWAAQVLLPRRLRGASSAPLPRLEEVRTMLADTVQEWTAQWVERGIEQGRAEDARRCAARRRASSTRRPGSSWPPCWRT